MRSWRNYIASMKRKWIGKKVIFENNEYTVVDVDYNGLLLIDREQYYCDTYTAKTTAVGRDNIILV